METTYSIRDTIELILEGGLLGMLGIIIHQIPAFARLAVDPFLKFKLPRFATNLFFGFVAGCLGISFLATSAASRISAQDTFTLIVLGYAAGDFTGRMINVIHYQGRQRTYVPKVAQDPFREPTNVADVNK